MKFLGISVEALTIDDLHILIGSAVEKNQKYIIANHNLHSLYIYHHDPEMREFYDRAEHVHIDGMPLVWLGRLFGYPLERKHRVTYVDWIRPLMAKSLNKGWRVFFLGSKPGVGEKAADVLKSEYPGLELRVRHGYFDMSPDSADNQEILQQIRDFRPHILMVGMGMPRQEKWIMQNLDEIFANIILPCGACMDYVAGEVPTPPRWMGQVGLEWLFRLFSEPKRLWRRYLVEPWFVLGLLLKEWLASKKTVKSSVDGSEDG